MRIYKMNSKNIPTVAEVMSRLKPDWWDYEGALGQLSGTEETVKTVGWYLGEDSKHPKGWLLCRELLGYLALELECCGYDDCGEFKSEHKLGALFKAAEDYAKKKGYLTFRSGISSTDFNIHGQVIASIPEAISNLRSDREDYKWYLDQGFRVIGIQPNAYGKGLHLIILAKDIS